MKAFTLLETLVVVAIIALIAALLFPVIARSKTAALERHSFSDLKQIGVAIQVYREREGSPAPYGTPAEMHLPISTFAMGLPYGIFRVKGPHRDHPSEIYRNHWPMGEIDLGFDKPWAEYTRRFEERSVLYYDLSFQDSPRVSSQWDEWKANAISLDLAVKTYRRIGYPIKLAWFHRDHD